MLLHRWWRNMWRSICVTEYTQFRPAGLHLMRPLWNGFRGTQRSLPVGFGSVLELYVLCRAQWDRTTIMNSNDVKGDDLTPFYSLPWRLNGDDAEIVKKKLVTRLKFERSIFRVHCKSSVAKFTQAQYNASGSMDHALRSLPMYTYLKEENFLCVLNDFLDGALIHRNVSTLNKQQRSRPWPRCRWIIASVVVDSRTTYETVWQLGYEKNIYYIKNSIHFAEHGNIMWESVLQPHGNVFAAQALHF